jgi:hypothetical protein|tara:strand:+ start:418 stop:672 length:255 start_codon:yes stop_codon:yes gene_type:complete
MALTKTVEIGRIEVVGDYKHIQVRTDTIVKEDGVELSRKFHRHVIESNISDENLAKEDAQVQAVANGVWTDAVKQKWTDFLATQ